MVRDAQSGLGAQDAGNHERHGHEHGDTNPPGPHRTQRYGLERDLPGGMHECHRPATHAQECHDAHELRRRGGCGKRQCGIAGVGGEEAGEPCDEVAVVGGVSFGERDKAADQPEKDHVEQRRRDGGYLPPRTPSLRGHDDEGEHHESQRQGGKHRFGHRVHGPFGQPLVDQCDQAGDGQEIAGNARHHRRADPRRRPSGVQRLEQVTGDDTDQPRPQERPSRTPGPALGSPVRPEPVRDGGRGQDADDGCVDRRVEDRHRALPARATAISPDPIRCWPSGPPHGPKR